MTVVYVDTLFLLNLTIDYLLLRLSARICGQYVPTLRLALGALMGAVYALCAFLPQGHFLTYPPVKVAVGVALALTAFGGRQRLLRLRLSIRAERIWLWFIVRCLVWLRGLLLPM